MNTIRRPVFILLIIAMMSSTLTATLAFTPPVHSENADVAVAKSDKESTFSFFTPLFHDVCSPACVRQTDPSVVVPPTQQAIAPPPAPKKKTPATTNDLAPNMASLNPRIETVIAFALSQVGKPYRWAAAGPSSYDCSGLVMAAFSKIGIRLPHFTGAIIKFGKIVSYAELRRGDIVFPGTRHVAIYLGNKKMVHAPQPGESVKVSSVYAFYAGRRLV